MVAESVVLVDGVRTAIGRFAGSLRNVPAFQLGGVVIEEAVRRAGIEGSNVDEVIMGSVGTVGPEAFNARRATLAAGLPVSTPAMNVNRLCGSGLQAIWTGVNQIRLGESDVVVAGGNENMSAQPFLDYDARRGNRLGDHRSVDGTLSLVTDPWGNYPMGMTAEAVAKKFDVSRAAQDEFALTSQTRAKRAMKQELFRDEIVAVPYREGKKDLLFETDEHPRPDTTMEKLSSLRPAFEENGTVTAGNSSGINDGAAAVVLMTEDRASALGLRPKARLVAFSKAAIEPEIMGYAPVYAIERLLRHTGMAVSDIGVFELNEAFAAQSVAVVRDAKLNPSRVNPNGGAIAFGHPIGATGTLLAVKIVYDMHRRDLEWGVVTMCIGGGQAVAALLQTM